MNEHDQGLTMPLKNEKKAVACLLLKFIRLYICSARVKVPETQGQTKVPNLCMAYSDSRMKKFAKKGLLGVLMRPLVLEILDFNPKYWIQGQNSY